jgi:hypothetical protein
MTLAEYIDEMAVEFAALNQPFAAARGEAQAALMGFLFGLSKTFAQFHPRGPGPRSLARHIIQNAKQELNR